MATTIEYDFKEIKEDIKNLEIGQTRLETELKAVKSDVSGLKTSQNAQIWVLIITVLGAFVKFSFFPSSHS